MTLEELVSEQQTLNDDLETLLTNLKKDGTSRRTTQYLKERGKDIWSLMQNSHKTIVSLNMAHNYLQMKFHETIKECYNKIATFISVKQIVLVLSVLTRWKFMWRCHPPKKLMSLYTILEATLLL